METGAGDDIDLDGGVTARVVDLTSVDLGDGRHLSGVEWTNRTVVRWGVRGFALQIPSEQANGWVPALRRQKLATIGISQARAEAALTCDVLGWGVWGQRGRLNWSLRGIKSSQKICCW